MTGHNANSNNRRAHPAFLTCYWNIVSLCETSQFELNADVNGSHNIVEKMRDAAAWLWTMADLEKINADGTTEPVLLELDNAQHWVAQLTFIESAAERKSDWTRVNVMNRSFF